MHSICVVFFFAPKGETKSLARMVGSVEFPAVSCINSVKSPHLFSKRDYANLQPSWLTRLQHCPPSPTTTPIRRRRGRCGTGELCLLTWPPFAESQGKLLLVLLLQARQGSRNLPENQAEINMCRPVEKFGTGHLGPEFYVRKNQQITKQMFVFICIFSLQFNVRQTLFSIQLHLKRRNITVRKVT